MEKIIFTCLSCNKNYTKKPQDCICGFNLYKVSGMSTTFTPLIDDEDSQSDPYRKKQYSPETGFQFTNPGGIDTPTESGLGEYEGPREPFNADTEDGGLYEEMDTEKPADHSRGLPSDGGVGDNLHLNSNGDNFLPDDSPLLTKNVSPFPFNNMKSTKDVDPYDIIRKRRQKI